MSSPRFPYLIAAVLVAALPAVPARGQETAETPEEVAQQFV